MSRRRAAVLVALGAVALTVSYPPFALPGLSFVVLAPAVLLLRHAESDRGAPAFAWGFWYGLAGYGLSLYWILFALWRFTPLSALGYAATIAIVGLWQGALFWFTVRARRRVPRLPLWVVFPVGWTAVEWIIGHQGDIGFPWLGLGTSLTESPILVQWADLAGARGITLWTAWTAVMLVDVATGLAARRAGGTGPRVLWRAAAVAASLGAALGYGAWRLRTVPVRVAGVVGMVQPNEGFRDKWEQGRADSVVGTLLGMSEQLAAGAKPDLVLWPEASIPGYLQTQPRWEQAIGDWVRRTRIPLLTGGLWAVVRAPDDYDYFNAALFFDKTGSWRNHPVYAKHYLVPVVERVPFLPPSWFGSLRFFGGFGRGRELPIYEAGIGAFGVLICYESAFEDLPRRYRRAGAAVLVNITNDAWFGRTSAPYQHEAHLVMRAIETRMGIARAANSGITEFVDPLGRAYARTALETRAAVVDTLRTSDVVTLYTRWGDWVGRLVVLATLVLGLVLLATRRRAGP